MKTAVLCLLSAVLCPAALDLSIIGLLLNLQAEDPCTRH